MLTDSTLEFLPKISFTFIMMHLWGVLIVHSICTLRSDFEGGKKSGSATGKQNQVCRTTFLRPEKKIRVCRSTFLPTSKSLLKVAFFQKVLCIFLNLQISKKKIFQKTILDLKFKVQFFWIFSFGDFKKESHFLKKKPPLKKADCLRIREVFGMICSQNLAIILIKTPRVDSQHEIWGADEFFFFFAPAVFCQSKQGATLEEWGQKSSTFTFFKNYCTPVR